jgi:hypothetical protein
MPLGISGGPVPIVEQLERSRDKSTEPQVGGSYGPEQDRPCGSPLRRRISTRVPSRRELSTTEARRALGAAPRALISVRLDL